MAKNIYEQQAEKYGMLEEYKEARRQGLSKIHALEEWDLIDDEFLKELASQPKHLDRVFATIRNVICHLSFFRIIGRVLRYYIVLLHKQKQNFCQQKPRD